MGVKFMYVFALSDFQKQLCAETFFNSLDLSEMFVLKCVQRKLDMAGNCIII